MIATGAAIALAIAGGASAGASAYAAKKAGDTNRRSIEAGERSDIRSVDLEREALAARTKAYNDAIAADQQRWADYSRIMEPHWAMSRNALGGLYDLAGYSGGPPPGAQGSGGLPPPGASAGPPPTLSDAMGSGAPPRLVGRGSTPGARPRYQPAPLVQMPQADTMQSLPQLMAMGSSSRP